MPKITTLLIFTFICTTNSLHGQTAKPFKWFYDKYPWQGQIGIKANVIRANNFGLEIGVLLTDIPKKKSQEYKEYFKDEGWCFVNQNIFLSTKYLSYNQYGTKVGYEINYVLLVGRASYEILYDKRNQEFSNLLYPEVGFTLFGFLNITYGYRFNLNQIQKNQYHQFSVGGNYFLDYMN